MKAHGALYTEVAKGGAVYETFRDAVRATVGERAALVLPSGCRAMAMVLRDGMTACEEGFCDRMYRADGGLVDHATAGAVLVEPDAAAAQALSLARGAVVARNGSVLTLWVDTLCIHGDSPGAVAMATAVRRALAESGIDVVRPRLRDALGPRRGGAPPRRPCLPDRSDRCRGGAAVGRGAERSLGRRGPGRCRRGGERRGHGAGARHRRGWRPLTCRESAENVATGVARRAPPDHAATRPGRLVTLPCRFDGEDLSEVAALVGCAPDDVVTLLTAQPFTASVIGFSPGFAYLDGLPDPLRGVPRRARPRAAVPPGSVAIANGHCAVYPTASPGGWHLVGRTAFPLFSPARPLGGPGARRPGALRCGGPRRGRGAGPGRSALVVTAAGRAPSSRSSPRASGRSCRMGVDGCGRRGRPVGRPADPCRSGWPTGWWATSRAGTLEVTGRHPAARPRPVPCGRRGVPFPCRRHDRTGGPPAPLRRDQVLEVGRQGGCRTYWRWRAASSLPSGSAAGPTDN